MAGLSDELRISPFPPASIVPVRPGDRVVDDRFKEAGDASRGASVSDPVDPSDVGDTGDDRARRAARPGGSASGGRAASAPFLAQYLGRDRADAALAPPRHDAVQAYGRAANLSVQWLHAGPPLDIRV